MCINKIKSYFTKKRSSKLQNPYEIMTKKDKLKRYQTFIANYQGNMSKIELTQKFLSLIIESLNTNNAVQALEEPDTPHISEIMDIYIKYRLYMI
jgi:hypothetical protein